MSYPIHEDIIIPGVLYKLKAMLLRMFWVWVLASPRHRHRPPWNHRRILPKVRSMVLRIGLIALFRCFSDSSKPQSLRGALLCWRSCRCSWRSLRLLFSPKMNSMPFFSALTWSVASKDLPLLAVIPSTFTALPSTRSLYCWSERVTPLISWGMLTRSARKAIISLVCGSMET